MMDNEEIARILEEIAVYFELKGDNPFKIRAYQNAARIIRSLPDPLADKVEPDSHKLQLQIKGIGSGLEEKIVEIIQTKTSSLLNELKSQIPSGLIELLKIPGLGTKKVHLLYQHVGITSLSELEKNLKAGKIRTLEGFGPKSEENIIRGLNLLKSTQNLFLFNEALAVAQEYLDYLSTSLSCDKIEIAGSLRRKNEIIGDIDILVSCSASKTMDIFTAYNQVREVLAQGTTKSSVLLNNGIQVDLRNVESKSYPFALNYFTGSKEHNTHLRKAAQHRGYKLNEYGLFDQNDRFLPCREEKDIYRHLGLHYIPPELREDLGEIEFFKENSSLDLVEKKDLKGILHCHTTMSDGRIPLENLIQAAKQEGYEYVGISDHSRTAYYAGGLTIEKLDKQWSEIDSLQKKHPDIRILKGIESDILPDGSLDYPPDILDKFDFIIASVHSHFKMNREEMSARIIKAVQNPYTTILGHPTGRLLLQRDPYPLDIEQILKACQKTGTWIEINGQPKRLDLDWREVKKANTLAIKLVITPDGHGTEMFEEIQYGVNAARKGWSKPENIMNTLNAEEFVNECLKLKKHKKISQ